MSKKVDKRIIIKNLLDLDLKINVNIIKKNAIIKFSNIYMKMCFYEYEK